LCADKNIARIGKLSNLYLYWKGMGHKKKTSKAQLCEKPAVLACLEPLLQNCLDSLSNKEQDIILKMDNKPSNGLN
jgi:hypothetical protein